MRTTKILSQLIIENTRFQVLYNKLVTPKQKKGDKSGKPKKGIMDFEVLKAIIFADPTTKIQGYEGEDIDTLSLEDMDNVKVGKYSQWLLKNFVNSPLTQGGGEYGMGSREYEIAVSRARALFLEDLYKTQDDLMKFDKFKQYLPQEQRDINKFTVESLFQTMTNFVIPEKFKKAQDDKVAKKSRDGLNHAGGEIVFEGPNWTMIKIEDKGQIGKDAAIYYGGFHDHENGETRWCTSGPGLTYFDGYIKNGPLYVIFPNDDKGEVGGKTGLPKERYQFHFPSNQYMDRNDRSINLVEMLSGKMSELKDFFKPEFAKGLTSNTGEKVEVNYPESAAGKFIALYGFDELFTSLPENIERLFVSNKSKENIALIVPSTITRFKNLSVLLFQNIVKELPENLGELSKLTIISLPDNKDLVSYRKVSLT